MLVLSRKPLQSVMIGSTRVTIISVHGDKIKLGIEAPSHVKISRSEQLLEARRADAGLQPVPELELVQS